MTVILFALFAFYLSVFIKHHLHLQEAPQLSVADPFIVSAPIVLLLHCLSCASFRFLKLDGAAVQKTNAVSALAEIVPEIIMVRSSEASSESVQYVLTNDSSNFKMRLLEAFMAEVSCICFAVNWLWSL